MHGDTHPRLSAFDKDVMEERIAASLNLEAVLRRRAGSGILQILQPHGKHVFTFRQIPLN
jgi:hypothetical protein